MKILTTALCANASALLLVWAMPSVSAHAQLGQTTVPPLSGPVSPSLTTEIPTAPVTSLTNELLVTGQPVVNDPTGSSLAATALNPRLRSNIGTDAQVQTDTAVRDSLQLGQTRTATSLSLRFASTIAGADEPLVSKAERQAFIAGLAPTGSGIGQSAASLWGGTAAPEKPPTAELGQDEQTNTATGTQQEKTETASNRAPGVQAALHGHMAREDRRTIPGIHSVDRMPQRTGALRADALPGVRSGTSRNANSSSTGLDQNTTEEGPETATLEGAFSRPTRSSTLSEPGQSLFEAPGGEGLSFLKPDILSVRLRPRLSREGRAGAAAEGAQQRTSLRARLAEASGETSPEDSLRPQKHNLHDKLDRSHPKGASRHPIAR